MQTQDFLGRYLFAFFLYLFSCIAFYAGWKMFSRRKFAIVNEFKINIFNVVSMQWVCFLILLFCFAYKLWGANWDLGGLYANRWTPSASSTIQVIQSTANQIALELLFVCTGLLLFAKRHRLTVVSLFCIVFPAFICSFLTLSRGTTFGLFIGLTILFLIVKPKITLGVKVVNSHMLALGIIFFGALSFLVYGWFRNIQMIEYYKSPSEDGMALYDMLTSLFGGSGLEGIANVVHYFPSKADYLHGVTVFQSFALPIPRLFWEAKPEWYGIQQINNVMNLNPYSQSAVTMIGEGYANFGLFGGLFYVSFLGALYGIISHISRSRLGLILYIFIVIPTTMTLFWMSTIGMMNSLIRLPLIFLALFIVSIRFDKNWTSKSLDKL
ncbi:MAG: O-antigen polymerase [Pseudomonadota bacterium]